MARLKIALNWKWELESTLSLKVDSKMSETTASGANVSGREWMEAVQGLAENNLKRWIWRQSSIDFWVPIIKNVWILACVILNAFWDAVQNFFFEFFIFSHIFLNPKIQNLKKKLWKKFWIFFSKFKFLSQYNYNLGILKDCPEIFFSKKSFLKIFL